LEDADCGLPPKKKQKAAEEGLLTEGEFRTEVVDALGAIEGRMRQQWVEAARLARATELQNYLLHQEKSIFLLLPFPTFFSFYIKKDGKGGKRIKRQ